MPHGKRRQILRQNRPTIPTSGLLHCAEALQETGRVPRKGHHASRVKKSQSSGRRRCLVSDRLSSLWIQRRLDSDIRRNDGKTQPTDDIGDEECAYLWRRILREPNSVWVLPVC